MHLEASIRLSVLSRLNCSVQCELALNSELNFLIIRNLTNMTSNSKVSLQIKNWGSSYLKKISLKNFFTEDKNIDKKSNTKADKQGKSRYTAHKNFFGKVPCFLSKIYS